MEYRLNIALIEPEIPQNTGNIARTCAATGAAGTSVRPSWAFYHYGQAGQARRAGLLGQAGHYLL